MVAQAQRHPQAAYRPPPHLGDGAAERVCRLATALLGASHAWVRLAVGAGVASASGASGASGAPTAEDVLAREVLRLDGQLVVGSPDDAPSEAVAAAMRDRGWKACAGLPLRAPDGRTAGVLMTAFDTTHLWSDEDQSRLADLAAICAGQGILHAAGGDGRIATIAQREAQEARRKSEERLALIFDSTTDITFLLAVEGEGRYRCVAVNESFLALTGLVERQVVGRTVDEYLPPERARRAHARFAEALAAGAPLHYEETLELPLGERVVEVTLTPIPGDGAGAHILGVGRDVTPHRQVEAELRAAKEAAEEARAAAEEANRAKSDFLSRMSHELRTPLNSVIGFANVLRANKGGRLDGRDLSYLDRIVTNGRHLLSIISDMLDIARIEAGKMTLSIAPVPLAPLVRTTLAGFEPHAAGRPITLRAELPPALARLDADATRLQQVLINLVGNALKFTERGTVTVRVEADPATGRPLRIAVTDTGVGIPPDRHESVFHAFEQIETGTARSFDGTGLGLAISRSLCQLMGYTLSVQSQSGEGATFTVDLTG